MAREKFTINNFYAKRTWFDYMGFAISVFGGILTVIGLVLSANSDVELDSLATKINITFIVLLIISIILFLIFWRRSVVGWRYAKAYEKFNEAFAELHDHDISAELDTDLQESIELLQKFCTKIAEAFVMISGKKVYACIKFFFNEREYRRICVMTLCRDFNSEKDGKRTPVDQDDSHYISDNSDFKHIVDNIGTKGPNGKFFFNNNLPGYDFYQNSRLDSTNYPPKNNFFLIKEVLRRIKWPLPYRSTIVVPIVPLSDDEIDRERILGFFCLDSPKVGAFRKRYDISILRGVADGLHPIFNQLKI